MEKRKRILFLYEFKLGHKAPEATRSINGAFGTDTVSERTTRRWFEKFWSGGVDLQSEPRRHPGSSIEKDELRLLVESDTRQSVRDITEKLDVHYLTVFRHFQQLGKVKKTWRFEWKMQFFTHPQEKRSLFAQNGDTFDHTICSPSVGGCTGKQSK